MENENEDMPEEISVDDVKEIVPNDIMKEIETLQENVSALERENESMEGELSTLSEALSVVEEEDYLWTRMGPGTQFRDLPIQKLRELQERSWASYNLNPIAFRRINFVTNLVTGKQLQFLSSFSDIKGVIDKFWTDPLNKMPLKIKEYINQAQLDGEVFLRFFINTATGMVIIRVIPSEEIAQDDDIITDPDDPEIELYYKRRYVRKVYDGGTYRSSNLVEYIPSIDLIDERDDTPEEDLRSNKVRVEGELINRSLERTPYTESFMYHIKLTPISSKKRGMPVLASMLYWLTEYKNLLKSRILLNKARASYVLDVAVEGDEEQVKAERKKHRYPPRPGSVQVHSTKVTYEFKAPSVNADDVSADMRNVRMMAVAGAELPEDILTGDTKEAKVASSKSTKFAFIKTIEATQDFWRQHFLYGVIYVVLYSSMRWGKGVKKWYHIKVQLTDEEQDAAELAQHADEYQEDLEGIENKSLVDGKKYANLPSTSKKLLENVSVPGKAEASSQLGLSSPKEESENDDEEKDEIEKPKNFKIIKKRAWELVETVFPEVDTEELTALAQAFNIFSGIGMASRQTMATKAGLNWEIEKDRMDKEKEDSPPGLGGMPGSASKKGVPQKPMPAGMSPSSSVMKAMADNEEVDEKTSERMGAVGGSRSPVQDNLKK